MELEVTEVAREAGVSVDTVRFYQTSGLLPHPERRGRNAVYSEHHLERLRLIRSMAARGLSLKVIAMLLDRDRSDDTDRALLSALEEEAATPTLGSKELARALGVPHALVKSVEKAGLAEGQVTADGETRYTEGDLTAARGALKLLDFGFPLTKLLALAVKHDRAVRKTCEEAIDLFDDYVRKPAAKTAADGTASETTAAGTAHSERQASGETQDETESDTVADAFKKILPVLVAVIAHHFQRVLVNRALRRLRAKGTEGELGEALEVASKNRVQVSWK